MVPRECLGLEQTSPPTCISPGRNLFHFQHSNPSRHLYEAFLTGYLEKGVNFILPHTNPHYTFVYMNRHWDHDRLRHTSPVPRAVPSIWGDSVTKKRLWKSPTDGSVRGNAKVRTGHHAIRGGWWRGRSPAIVFIKTLILQVTKT